MVIKLYDNIRRRRKELGMTQSQLAAKMHYADKSMIAKIEKGIVDLPQSKIISFAKALDTSPAELMGWNGIEEAKSKPTEHAVRIPLCTGFEDGRPVLSDSAYELSVNMDTHLKADFILPLQDTCFGNGSIYVRRQEKLEDGVPFVFYYQNQFLLRQPYRYANETLLLLRSADPEKPDIEITKSKRKNLYILGKVIAVKSNVL